ncbi:MAG TPA: hypothetical protein PK668_21285 [Myxococcota bacterium]|nr:hypothetical protein [Myxococcota bacterium]HRY96010.1 hypothetical protein [Myxococcota bacterium]
MRALRFLTGLALEPFGDPISSALLGVEELGLAVARALLQAGAKPEPGFLGAIPARGELLLLPDTLFVTRAAARAFLAAVPGGPGVYRLALRRGPASEYARPLQRVDEDGCPGAVGYDLYLARGELEGLRGADSWEALRERLRARATPVVVEPGPEVELLPEVRPGPPRTSLAMPRTLCLAADVRHWVHVLWLNHLLPRVRLREHWQDHPLRARLRGAGAADPRRLNVLGRGCDIHPTALVEGSILGDHVQIGPFASVRECILGDGVEVGSHTHFKRCVVGAGCNTLNDSYFIGCTFYPGSTLANLMLRNSVLGRRVFMTTGVTLRDDGLTGPISVVQAGREVPTGRWVLGGCAGHGSQLGARALLEPGRAVPNRTTIILRPEEAVGKLPTRVEPRRPYTYFESTLLPVEQAYPGWSPPEIDQEEPR